MKPDISFMVPISAKKPAGRLVTIGGPDSALKGTDVAQ
jgi:hypothetical protein